MTTLRQYRDLVAIPVDDQILGFHARNLEVASLSQEAWQFLESPLNLGVSLESKELQAWDAFENPNVLDGKVSFGIRSLTLNVSQICNLHCSYCAAGGDGTYKDPVKSLVIEKTLPQIQWLLEKVPAGDEFTLTFLGGEPLLYPKVIEALAEFASQICLTRQIRLRLAVVTNGTLINEEVLQILVRFRFSVAVSLDGPPEVNDRTRPDKTGHGVTSLVVQNIHWLEKQKDSLSSLGLTAVFDQNNLQVVEAYQFFSTFSVDYFELNFSHTEKDLETSRKFVTQMKKVAQLAFAKGGEQELRRIKFFDHHFQKVDDQQRVENFCGSGRSFLMIDARNNAYSCPWLVGDKQDLLGHGTLLNFSQMKKEAHQQTLESHHCGSCWARYLCGGGCMFIHKEQTGDKHLRSEVFCERTRDLIATVLMYYFKSRITLIRDNEVCDEAY